MDQFATTFFNSNYMRLYQKTAFRFDFGVWEVHESESVCFYENSGWGTYQSQKFIFKAVF